ncbi:MAG: zinc ribbon domain-containing protein [Gemmatimonadaceae bacterium]
MDDVDRMYRHLVRTIRATSPQLLTQPFQVGDLYTTILPYRLHRREVGVETNQDYEMALLELLSGGRGYLAVDDRMREELGAALNSPNPDTTLIRNFTTARVALAPDALAKLEQANTTLPSQVAQAAQGPQAALAASPGTPLQIPISPIKEPDTAPFRASGSMASAVSASAGTRRAPRPITVSPTGERCRHCKGELPTGREIIFCPHCGQDLTVLHCPACGSELEHGWKFCVTCGRSAGDL